MKISSILTAEQILANLKSSSKKQVLSDIAHHAASVIGISHRDIFDTLLQRERLGSTGTGNGIAIPHGKLSNIDRLYSFVVKLESPVDFDSVDDQPVDLIVVLLAPETSGADHLKALARYARLLRDEEVVNNIRGADNSYSIFSIISEQPESHAA